MKILILDLETTVQRRDGKIDNSPFHPDNKCVSAHFCWLGAPVTSLVFYHKEQATPDDPAPLRKALEEADMLVAHNAKFDVMWLMEMGFRIPDRIYDTMIGEYLLRKGQNFEKDEDGNYIAVKLSLKATAERRAA